MRILLVNDYYTGGGAEGVFRTTLELLQKHNYEVDFFVGSKELKHPNGLLSYLYNKEIAQKLAIKLNNFKPNIIHIHNYYHYLSPSIFRILKEYKKRNTLKIVFTAHDYHLVCAASGMITHRKGKVIPIDVNKNNFTNIIFKKIDHRGIKYDIVKKMHWLWSTRILNTSNQIDLILAPSYFLKKVLELNSILTPIEVLRNPFVKTSINNEIQKTKTKEALKLLYIGRLSREKGLLEFLQVLHEHNIENITLDILGTGETFEVLESYIARNKLDYVKLHGHQTGNSLKKFLKNSNVLVLPSVWYENAPLSIIEGASYGNIILSSNLGGIKELTKLTKSYILIDDWAQEIKAALEKIKNMEPNFIMQPDEFSEDNYVLQLNKIYGSL